MDTEQIKNQYMSVSLDDIVKQNRIDKKKGRGFNKRNEEKNNNNSNGNESNGSPKLNVLETSLDDIVKSNQPKKQYIKKTQQYQQQQTYQQNYKISFKNNMNGGNNKFYQQQQQQQQFVMNNQQQFINKGLFNRNMNNKPFIQQQNRFQHQNRKFANHHNNPKLKNIPRTKITDSIDHKFFDPRGIRDYSQVKKPTTASMEKVKVDQEDIDEPEFDERGNELSYSVKVVNLPKTVIPSDIAYIFGIIGALKDFELDNEKCEATIIFKKKDHALAAIERYSGVELDGSLLILYESNNPLTKSQIDEKIASSKNNEEQSVETTTTTTTTSTTTTTTTNNEDDENYGDYLDQEMEE